MNIYLKLLVIVGLFLASCTNKKDAQTPDSQISASQKQEIEHIEKENNELEAVHQEIEKTAQELDALLDEIDN